MWRKGTLYGLIIGITMGWLIAAQGPVVGEDDSAIGIVKAKIEQGVSLTAAEKALAEREHLLPQSKSAATPRVLRRPATTYLTESFETWPPAGWTLDPASGDGAWQQDDGTTHGPGSVVDGSYAAYFDDYWYSTGTSGSMITPSIDLSTATAPRVSFYYWDSGGSDDVVVSVSTDGTNFTDIYTTATAVDPWEEQVVDLSNYAGQSTVYIRFTGTSVYGINNPHIDYVVVDEAPLYQPVLISEIVVTPTAGEYIEIYNPNGSAVDLSNFYLTDATYASGGTYYYNIVTGSNYGGGDFGDFHARFPDGASIAPGEYQTISLAGSDDFFATYGVAPTYELYEDGTTEDSIPDMREAMPGSINNQGSLTNGDEVVILYYWDGVSDLVKDSDYLLYDDAGYVPNEAVDKTGVSIDGPDADTTPSTYQDDTPIDSQHFALSPGYGYSAHRIDYAEGTEVQSGGNGIDGHDETSENTDVTFAISLPTPGGPAQLDLNEPNDNLAEATAIAIGDTLTGLEINPDGDLDFFTFTGAAGQIITIDMFIANYSSLDGKIALVDSDSVEIVSADNGWSGVDEQIADFQLPYDGTYYLIVGYWSDVFRSSTGAYALGISETQPAQGTSCSNPFHAVEGINTGAAPPVWYDFTPSMDGNMTVTSDINGQTNDTKVYIYADCQGSLIDVDDDGGTGFTSTLTVPVEAGVTYYIFWSDQWSSDPFDWELTVSGLPDFVVSDMYMVGDTLNVTVTNQGSGDSQGFFGTDYHGLYVNDVWQGYVAEYGVALAAGESHTYQIAGFNYDNLGAGDFMARFVCDVDDDVAESDETNNEDSLLITITPPPTVPRNLTAVGHEGYVSLRWDAAPIDTGIMVLRRANGAQLVDRKVKPVEELTPELIAKYASQDNGLRTTGDDCTDPFVVNSLPFTTGPDTLSTEGFNNDFSYGNGNDVVYQVTAPADGYLTASTCALDYGDTKLQIFESDCSTEIDHNDDACGLRSEVTVPVVGGNTYFVVVDGYSSGAVDYILDITWAATLPMPDLTVSDMWMTGDTVWAAVTNQGDADAGGVSNHWFVNGQDVGYAYTSPLAPGESDTLGLIGLNYENFGNPDWTPVDVVVGLQVDYWDSEDESDEENNYAETVFTIQPPEYIPAYNVYRDSVLIAEGLAPVGLDLHGEYVDADVENGVEYCYYVTQILPDSTESGGSDPACAMPVGIYPPPRGLRAVAWDGSVDLYWRMPFPQGEIAYDDGIAAWLVMVQFTAGPEDYMAVHFTCPFPPPYTLTDFSLFTQNGSAYGGDSTWQQIAVVPSDANGMPDLTNPLFDVADVPVPNSNLEWMFFNPDLQMQTQDFWVVVKWPEGSYYGPFLGRDDSPGTTTSWYTSNPDSIWNLDWDGEDYMIRAYVSHGNTRLALRADRNPFANVRLAKDAAVFSSPEQKRLKGFPFLRPGDQIAQHIPAPDIHVDLLQRFNGTYIVWRSTDDSNYVQIDSGLIDHMYTDMSVVNDQTYFYKVQAVYDSVHVSDFSNTAVATPMGVLNGMFSDFEADDGGLQGSGSWEWGVPTFGPDSAYSGSNVWATALDTNYENNADDWLITPPFNLAGMTNPAMGGAIWYDLEEGWDFAYSAVDEDNDGIFDIITTWTGMSDGWMVGHDVLMEPYAASDYARIALILQSDGSVAHPGFYLDNFRVGNGPQIEVSVESISQTLQRGEIFTDFFTISNPGELPLRYHLGRGYYQLTSVLFEDFNRCTLPAGWTTVSNSVGWQVGDNGSSSYFTIPDHDGCYAYSNDDAAGSGADGSVDYLITPSLDLTEFSEVHMHFDSYYDGSWSQLASVEVSTDSGATWDVLMYLEPADDWVPVFVDLSAYAGQPNVLVGFHADDAGHWASGWAIDNVFIYEPQHWLTIDDTLEGIVEPGGVDTVHYTLDADALPADTYEGLIMVHSELGDVNIPVSMTILNTPPAPFSLNGPRDSTSTVITTNTDLDSNWVVFEWHVAEDLDGDAVNYGIVFSGDLAAVLGNVVIHPPAATDTTVVADITYRDVHDAMANANLTHAAGTWNVFATDGVDTTWSTNGPWYFWIDDSILVATDNRFIPEQYALYQNFPNPFNPQTQIVYDLPEASQVRLTIYNLLGQAVAVLVNQEQQPGRYHIVWNGRSTNGRPVSSGVYFYRLETKGYTKTMKMLFLK